MNKTEEIVKYLTKMGIRVTVDNNPSKEKIERINKIIKKISDRYK